MTAHMVPIWLGPLLIIEIVIFVVSVLAWLQIITKAGYSGWWFLVSLVPVGNTERIRNIRSTNTRCALHLPSRLLTGTTAGSGKHKARWGKGESPAEKYPASRIAILPTTGAPAAIFTACPRH